jgi:heat shock protein 4
VIFETMQARNDLESYVLDMKSRLSGDLSDYATEKDKESFITRLSAEEEWLYNDGFDSQKSEYKKRINELKATGDAIASRHEEHHSRDTHIAALKSAIGHYSQWATSNEEKYAHISPEERRKVTEECNNVDQWLATALSAQDKLKKCDPPAVTIAQLKQKKTQLEQTVNPIMHKPKPAPPKPEKTPTPAPSPAPDAGVPRDPPAGAAGAAPEAAADAKKDDAKPMEQ